MNNSNVVIPNEVREPQEDSSALEREYPSTCTKVRSRRSLISLTMTIALLLLTAVSGFAQSITPEVISASGGDTANGNVGLSWTVGEPVIKTVSSPNAKITQGFHQSHFEVISVEEHPELGFDIKIYPNPSTDFINIELVFTGTDKPTQQTKLQFELLDNVGKVLITESIENATQHSISMQNYAQGQYFIRITGAKGQLHHSAQIIKLK